ncbi:MAG: biotin--[acetyl-CoA-carboxylase] ligase [Nitrospira sp.]|nr:biotin--[acetyl-CoA-carboxylase] ligase [Nitrospira sp.]
MLASTPLTLDEIRSTLATKSLGQQFHLHHELASTNSEALLLAHAGAPHGTVVVTEQQSAGRGRQTRHWHSPPHVNIYCSVVVRGIGPVLTLSEWLSWVPLVSALAVAEAVRTTTSVGLSLKWPNDLLFQDRKVGGILCESAHISSDIPIVVIGIGLNVNMAADSFPEDLRHTATSLYEISRNSINRNRLLSQLLLELEDVLDELRTHGSSRLRAAYMSHCHTIGRHIRLLLGDNQELLGTAESIGTDGALQVRPLAPSSGTPPSPLLDIRAADVIHLR